LKEAGQNYTAGTSGTERRGSWSVGFDTLQNAFARISLAGGFEGFKALQNFESSTMVQGH